MTARELDFLRKRNGALHRLIKSIYEALLRDDRAAALAILKTYMEQAE